MIKDFRKTKFFLKNEKWSVNFFLLTFCNYNTLLFQILKNWPTLMHIAQVPKVPQDTFGKWPTPESSNNLKLCKVLEKFFTEWRDFTTLTLQRQLQWKSSLFLWHIALYVNYIQYIPINLFIYPIHCIQYKKTKGF